MAIKKHEPKHRRQRGTIRRARCPFCDGMSIIASMTPPFGVYAEGNSLPFAVDVCVDGLVLGSSGALLVRFTYPDKEYRVFKRPELDMRFLDFKDPAYPVYMDAVTKDIRRQRQQFAFPIDYCPICGRKFKSNRQKLWR